MSQGCHFNDVGVDVLLLERWVRRVYSYRNRFRDLRDFQRMRQAIPEEIRLGVREKLRLAVKPPEGW